MRILNRPMFRYGGPIKEGIMSGMKNGGRAALVGNPVYPKTDGREHHFAVSGTIATVAAANAARIAAQRAAMRYGPRALSYIKNWFGKNVAQNVGTTNVGGKIVQTVGSGSKWVPNWLGRDPLVQGAGWGYKALTSPASKGFGKGLFRFATAPSTLIGGLWFANGKWFNKKGEEVPPPKGMKDGPPGGGETALGSGEAYYEKPPVTKSAEESAAEAKAARTKKLNKYLDTMGYDKAKKRAMGDALIDASAIVQAGTEEGGSLKHADWGKMINQAIQTTSKRLDKPEQIREAVGLMLTKSEIEKDLEDPQVKRLRALQIEDAEEKLNRGFEKDMREFILARKEAPDKEQLERFARLTADEYKIDFKKISDEDIAKVPEGATEEERMQIVGMTDDGIYMIGGDIVRVTGGIPKQIA